MEHKMIELGPGMPSMNTTNFWWNNIGDPFMERVFFDVVLRGTKSIDSAEWILCNSFTHAELPVFKCAPKIRPIGPLLHGLQPDKVVGHYWPEDSSCVEWLNQQPPKSIVYVAFGSFTELALGLEMMGRRFLWVVGLRLSKDAEGVVRRGEIKAMVEALLGDGDVVGRALELKEVAARSIGEGGSSFDNFNEFVESMKKHV
ncbi:UDP-glycosyltransferase 83A1 [Acorus calamus]|uniref:UDP-glycosyltransferase 83A1 n=1 Tax=Acorus calamus TaxID=4465 RepID=A0AAV9EPM8_ACOCL|nr:UDP-glycosyltransferase 83A1 [Acorus calamus]